MTRRFDAGEIFDRATPDQLAYLRRLSASEYYKAFSHFADLRREGKSYDEIIYTYFKDLAHLIDRDELRPWTRQIPRE